MLFSDCTTLDDWMSYYSDATRNELRAAYDSMVGYVLNESEENRLQAVKTLMSETNDWRFHD